MDDNGSLVASDAQRVLRKSVGQDVSLVCECSGGGPVCGDGVIEGDEECEADNLGESCASLGAAGGTLRCAAGCVLDMSGCYDERFDTSGPTIIDRQTGLEWEKKKDHADGVPVLGNPNDADNGYTWTLAGSAPNGTRTGRNPPQARTTRPSPGIWTSQAAALRPKPRY